MDNSLNELSWVEKIVSGSDMISDTHDSLFNEIICLNQDDGLPTFEKRHKNIKNQPVSTFKKKTSEPFTELTEKHNRKVHKNNKIQQELVNSLQQQSRITEKNQIKTDKTKGRKVVGRK